MVCNCVCVTTKRVKCVNRINVSFEIFIGYISKAKQSVAVHTITLAFIAQSLIA